MTTFQRCYRPVQRSSTAIAAVVVATSWMLAFASDATAQESAAAAAQLQEETKRIVTSGNHPEIKWPRFPAYVDELEAVYAPTGYGPVWFVEGRLNPKAERLIAEIALAQTQGLDPEDYDVARLAETGKAVRRGEVTDPRELARFDTALSIAFLRYVSDLHIGRINPKNLHPDLSVEENKYDLAAILTQALEEGDIESLIANVQPRIPAYARLKQILPKYRALAADPAWTPLPVAEPALRPGDPYVATLELARLLVAVGDMPETEMPAAPEDGSAPIYDGGIVDAVKRYQTRHGLEADGILGAGTFRALNTPFSQRVRSIEMALERLRWLPFLGDERIVVVDIPAFRLWAFDRGKLGTPDISMNVIVGKSITETRTPIFSERIQYLDFSPFWNVPFGITKDELLPKIRNDPGYLDAHDFEIVAQFGNDEPALPATRENIDALAHGKTNLRQRPGPNNALGAVKFIFPNAHNVYLHSTPAQQLFARTKRDFSHGCIRIEKPAELAAWLLRGDPEWNVESIEAAMNGARPRRVFLESSVPVYIVYASVIVDQEGQALFFPDVYEYDEKLEKVLDAGYPYPP